MRGFLRSGVLGLVVVGTMLVADSTAQAQRRDGGRGGRASASVRADVGRGYGNRSYSNRYYGNRYDGRYYGNYNRYGYGYNRYYGGYPRSSYNYPRSSYYSGPSARYSYYTTSGGWRVCYDRYTGNYWYLSGGSWYRWY